MPFDDQIPQFYRPVASSRPEPVPKREWVRRTCPKVTALKPPGWVSKREIVGGRCNYIGPDKNLCPHWRAEDSDACPCHVEAYEGPDSTAGMRVKRTRKKTRRIAVMMKPDPGLWNEKEPL
jgi:hypothetical protein